MARSLCVGAGRVRAVALVLMACVVSFAAASSAPAATVGQSYSYTGDVGTPDSGSVTTVFNNLVAVSAAGNVFIVRQQDPVSGLGGVVVLDPTGSELTRIDTEFFFPAGVAVSADGSAVYVSDSFQSPEIQKFVSDGAATPTYTRDPSWTPAAGLRGGSSGIAVDPVTGDLVVADGRLVYRYSSSTGALLSSFDGSTSGTGKFAGTGTITIGPNRDIYVVDDPGRVLHMGADGSWKGDLAIPNQGAVAKGVAVNPQNGDVAVEIPAGYGATDAVIRIYSASNDLKDVIRIDPAQDAVENHGLAFAPDGSKLYLANVQGAAHVFTRGTQPGVDAPTATNVTTSGARLSAVVATNGSSSLARIEYCLATDPCAENLTSDGSSPWHRLADHPNLTGSDPAHPGQDTIEDDVTGLAPNTRYLLRTYAINDASQVEVRSASSELTTAVPPPDVTTGAAGDVTDSSAELSGSVDNTYGGQTTYHFEYGLTTNYEGRLPAGAEGVAGNLRTPRTFTEIAKGLQPGTTYHYRLVATNSGGSTAGADRTFTTLGVDQVAPHRGYEQVTAANKQGLSLKANWGFQAASDGSAFEYGGTSPSSAAPSAAVVSRYVAWRGGTDWVGQQPLDPPFLPARAVINSVTLAVSADFKHALVVSQVALAAGATQGATNIYVKDLDTGAYTLVGSSSDSGAFVGMTGILRLNTFTAGAPDFSWVVLTSQYRLRSDAPQTAMYKWTRSGGLTLVSRLPGDTIPTGTVRPQNTSRVTPRLVSDDGNTVAFSLRNGDDGVYLRSGGQTVPVSVGRAGASGGPTGVQPGLADGISRDGRYVVFHSESQLTDDDQDGLNSEYRYDAQLDELTYLGPQDGTDDGMLDVPGIGDDAKTVYFNSNNQLVVWRDGQPGVDVVNPTAVRDNVSYGYSSPNGRFFEFLAADRSARLYDAVTGENTCLSCTAGGAVKEAHLPVPDRNISNRLPQVVTDDGHAYFDTPAPLVSADHNGTPDVYESFRGRLTLISPGDRDFPATFADISADGSNVFFATAEGLVSQDTDQSYDVYDARIGGGFAAQNPPPPDAPCAKSECAEPGPGPIASPPVGSPPQPQGKPGTRTNQAKVTLSITRVSIGAKTMKITFHASQRGRVKVSGARVATTYRNVTKEGTYSISVPLSKKARQLRHAKKRFKLAVKVSLAGGWGTASKKYSRTLR